MLILCKNLRKACCIEGSLFFVCTQILFFGSMFDVSVLLQPVETNDPSCSSQFLLPPKPEKQFLISPPCSPPDGWEPVNEKEPSINYDLIAAITNLAAGW